ncbi:hypothetical protein [Streptomyces prunicolor]
MTTHRPTRTCPHPLCRPLHAIAATGSLLVAAAVAPHGPWIIGILVIGGLFSAAIYQLVHRQTMVASIKEELHQTVTITARPAWARAAAIVDAIWTVIVLAMLASVLADQTASDWGTPSRITLLASVAVGVVLTATTEGLHRRAVHIERVQADTEA